MQLSQCLLFIYKETKNKIKVLFFTFCNFFPDIKAYVRYYHRAYQASHRNQHSTDVTIFLPINFFSQEDRIHIWWFHALNDIKWIEFNVLTIQNASISISYHFLDLFYVQSICILHFSDRSMSKNNRKHLSFIEPNSFY